MSWDKLKGSNVLTLLVKILKLQRDLVELRMKQQTARAMHQIHALSGKKDAVGKATN